jgi:hypothetical protein
MKYEIGKTYTLQKNMYIRESPNGELVKSVTEDAKKHMDKFPILKKGTRVTCRDIQLGKNGSTWIKCPSGWICAMSYRGTIYIN